MKVSVIITTYKRPDYLSEAIESVLKQSFRDFELIVVDDDPDGRGVEKIVLSYQDPRIFYIKNKENLGGAKSLNIGLKKARGEYVAVLDDDDAWIGRDKLEKQISFLDNNSDYVIIGTNSSTTESENDREVSKPIKNSLKIKDFQRILLSGPFFPHSSVLYRKKEALLVGGYSELLPRGKDLDLYFKISNFGKFGFLPECLVKHREVSEKERNIIKTRYVDSLFHRKILWRHRTNNIYFWFAYFRINLRCLLFFFFKISPFPYYIYRKCRYGRFSVVKKN